MPNMRIGPEEQRPTPKSTSPLEVSSFTLLQMGALCALLAVGIVIQLAFLRPSPKATAALRAVVIPEAAAKAIPNRYKYRHFLSQIVQRSRRLNFYQGRDLSDLIIRVSLEENIDPLFVAAIIKAESTFLSNSVSHKGAHGLMQLLPNTAAYISGKMEQPWQGERFLHDPEYNLRLGIYYLKYLSKKFDGNIEKVLAAYNWGPAKVRRLGGSLVFLPAVTKRYVSSVLGNHRRWKDEWRAQSVSLLSISTNDLA